MAIKFLSKIKSNKLRGVALLRLDFNAQDPWRINAVLPTIKSLKRFASQIIIISHKGRPQGIDKKLSLNQETHYLASKIKTKINFIDHFNFKKIKKEIKNSPPHSIFVLENIRFLKGEQKEDLKLAKKLADLGDYFVNDAFAVSHRRGASITGLPKFLPAYAGLNLEKEIFYLNYVMRKPQKPLILILGGAKSKDKLPVINNFLNKANFILIGGALANTLLYAYGINIYNSLIEKDKKILNQIKKFKNNQKIILPVDHKIKNKAILDIGPKTIKVFQDKIKLAKTIIWNGPLGKIEEKPFMLGTLKIAQAIVNNKKTLSIVGGGETITFLKKQKLDKKIKFISTGGGAMLEFLAGKKLPGIEALKNKN